MKKVNIVIAGVGGQGVTTIGMLLKYAAVKAGIMVSGSETRGASQREGSVNSHVRFGVLEPGEEYDERRGIHSSLVPSGTADLLIGFEPMETLRNARYVSSNGIVIMNTYEIWPIPVRVGEVSYPPIEKFVEALKAFTPHVYTVNANKMADERYGGYTMAGTILLGIAYATGRIPLKTHHIEETIRERLDNPEENIDAFRFGYEEGKKLFNVKV
ncbi:MAG: indolepyruvate oxidoreductase subunit beta [Candidatus Jordarchaeales archaeon]